MASPYAECNVLAFAFTALPCCTMAALLQTDTATGGKACTGDIWQHFYNIYFYNMYNSKCGKKSCMLINCLPSFLKIQIIPQCCEADKCYILSFTLDKKRERKNNENTDFYLLSALGKETINIQSHIKWFCTSRRCLSPPVLVISSVYGCLDGPACYAKCLQP